MSGKIGVALSGGVDSLCALILLKRAGRDVFALHGEFVADKNRERIERLASICDRLNAPLRVVDLKKEFSSLVSEPFREAWMSGLTPNPCVVCNKKIKFGKLLEIAREFGCETLATGHYVAKRKNVYGSGSILSRASCARKDQSYFLALLDKEQIEGASFPLGFMEKSRVRAIVREAGFEIPEREESRDICFIKGGYAAALAAEPIPGPIILRDKRRGVEKPAGTHQGLWNYTIGQRKGLRIPYREPLYAIKKDIEANILYIGTKTELGQTGATIIDPVYRAPPELWPKEIFVKIRSVGEPVPCAVSRADDIISARFLNAKASVAAGQAAAFYDASGVLLAGGTLDGRDYIL